MIPNVVDAYRGALEDCMYALRGGISTNVDVGITTARQMVTLYESSARENLKGPARADAIAHAAKIRAEIDEFARARAPPQPKPPQAAPKRNLADAKKTLADIESVGASTVNEMHRQTDAMASITGRIHSADALNYAARTELRAMEMNEARTKVLLYGAALFGCAALVAALFIALLK